jgi:hypothetical protein
MSSLVHRRVAITALCLACAFAPPLAADTRAAMADAMVRMMEAMGLFGGTGASFATGPQGWANPMGMSGWPAGFGTMPMMPGTLPIPTPGGMDPMSQMSQMGQMGQMDPTGQLGKMSQMAPTSAMNPAEQMSRMGQMMEQLSAGTPGAGMMPWGASPLEGIWEGNDSGLLIVQGGRYRLYAPFSGFIDGEIRVSGDRVELTNRREQFSQEFEVAQDQGRLVFRDRQGQLYLYRKLDLDEAAKRDQGAPGR